MRLDETVVNFTSHRGHQIPAFRILKWGGADTRPLARRTFGCIRGETTKGYELFSVAAPTRPPPNCTKKNPRTGRGRGFPCDSARRGKESRRIDRPTIGLPAQLCQPTTLSLPFRNSHAMVARWASSHISTLSALERSAPWSQRVWHL